MPLCLTCCGGAPWVTWFLCPASCRFFVAWSLPCFSICLTCCFSLSIGCYRESSLHKAEVPHLAHTACLLLVPSYPPCTTALCLWCCYPPCVIVCFCPVERTRCMERDATCCCALPGSFPYATSPPLIDSLVQKIKISVLGGNEMSLNFSRQTEQQLYIL
jgi:hypothetical protein